MRKGQGQEGRPARTPPLGVFRGAPPHRPTTGTPTGVRRKCARKAQVLGNIAQLAQKRGAGDTVVGATPVQRDDCGSRVAFQVARNRPALVRSANWYGLLAWSKTGVQAAANERETSRRNMSPVASLTLGGWQSRDSFFFRDSVCCAWSCAFLVQWG